MTSRDPQGLAPQVSSVHGAHGLSRPPPVALDFTPFSQGVRVRPKASTQLPHLLSSDPRIQAESRVGAHPCPAPRSPASQGPGLLPPWGYPALPSMVSLHQPFISQTWGLPTKGRPRARPGTWR